CFYFLDLCGFAAAVAALHGNKIAFHKTPLFQKSNPQFHKGPPANGYTFANFILYHTHRRNVKKKDSKAALFPESY
ncbi:MAG: hypothetical protein IIU70_03035, partial [Anaerotignum sp.]|nr:hypothetical protein [Anaerotignum sp.]